MEAHLRRLLDGQPSEMAWRIWDVSSMISSWTAGKLAEAIGAHFDELAAVL